MRGQAGQPQQDNAYDFLWVIVLSFGAIFAIWYFGKDYIASFIYQVKMYEIYAIQYVLNYWNMLVNKFHLPSFLNVAGDDLNQWVRAIKGGRADTDYQALANILIAVGNYLRFPVALILVIMAYIVYSKNIVLRFKTIFTMKTMRQAEQKDWPQITPILSMNLAKEDINKGPWAMAMSPMQFSKNYHLLKEKTGDDGKAAVDLIHQEAYQVFVLQLGPLWTNINAQPIHIKALFAVFAASANNDRTESFKLLKQISNSAGKTGKLNFEGTDALLAKHYNTKVVMKVMQKHAYMLTMMASMLELARTDGVFATSEFLWLKPVDRKLWYMLNAVGRQTSVAEISGPFAHWLAEKKWGTGLRTPMVEESVKALDMALADIIYEPDEK